MKITSLIASRVRTAATALLTIAATVYLLAGSAADIAADELPASSWPEVLTLSEASLYLRIEPDDLRRLARDERVPARRVADEWRFSRAALEAWLAGEWRVIAVAERAGDERPLATSTLASIRAAGPGAGAAVENDDRDRIGEAPEEDGAEDIFLRGQRVLLRPGDVTLDIGSFYSESNDRLLVELDGGIALSDVDSEAVTGFLLARYGLFEETELFLGTSYVDEDMELRVGGTRLDGDSRSELGDFRIGLRRTLLTEAAGRPDVILTLDGRIPSDEDHTSYAVGAGIGMVKSADPLVLFANISYRHTFSEDFDDVTRLEAENRLDLNLGYAFAVNDTLSLNTTLSGVITDKTSFDNATLLQDELFSLQFSLTSWLAEGLYIEPVVGFRLNGRGDGFFLGLTLPYTFEP